MMIIYRYLIIWFLGHLSIYAGSSVMYGDLYLVYLNYTILCYLFDLLLYIEYYPLCWFWYYTFILYISIAVD